MTNSFKGILMDGERWVQLLAWGTAPVENYKHWDWFAFQLRQGLARDYEEQKREEAKGDGGEEVRGDGGEGRKGDGGEGEEENNPQPPPISRMLAIFTDREKGLAKAIKNHFPNCSHFFCVFHIEKNIRVKFTLKEATKNMIWAASKAPLLGEFEIWMKRIEQDDSRVHNYLQKILPAQWADAYAPIRKWGIHTSNSSESMNSWMRDARDKSHATLHATLVAKCMARQCQRREMYEGITHLVGTNTQKALLRTVEAGRLLHILPGSPDKSGSS
jgi:hypothetical protein